MPHCQRSGDADKLNSTRQRRRPSCQLHRYRLPWDPGPASYTHNDPMETHNALYISVGYG